MIDNQKNKEENIEEICEKIAEPIAFCITSIPFTLFMTWCIFYFFGLEWCFNYGAGIWCSLCLLKYTLKH